MKTAAPRLFNASRQLPGLTGAGNDHRPFERDTLAELIAPRTAIPRELELPMFGRSIGLGLAAASEVACHHGGTAGVSRTPGGGARFRIEFPIAA